MDTKKEKEELTQPKKTRWQAIAVFAVAGFAALGLFVGISAIDRSGGSAQDDAIPNELPFGTDVDLEETQRDGTSDIVGRAHNTLDAPLPDATTIG